MILLHLPVDISFPLSFCHLACNNFITGGPLINGHLYYYGEGGPGGYHGVGVIDTGMFKELPEFLTFRHAQTNLKVRLMCEVVSFVEKNICFVCKIATFLHMAANSSLDANCGSNNDRNFRIGSKRLWRVFLYCFN